MNEESTKTEALGEEIATEAAKIDTPPEETANEASGNATEERDADTRGGEAIREADIDYEALMASDVAELKAEFPELAAISDVTDLNNPLRYAALRDLGLTPAEAYLATAKRVSRDTRSHLKAAHGRNAAASEVTMSPFELATARELFPGKNDAELQRLYKRVAR